MTELPDLQHMHAQMTNEIKDAVEINQFVEDLVGQVVGTHLLTSRTVVSTGTQTDVNNARFN